MDRAAEPPPIDLSTLASTTPGARCTGDALVERLTYDSRDVRPGDLYVALPGIRHDGHRFVDEAYGRGAVAAVVGHVVDVPLEQVVVPSVRRAVGPMAAAFYGYPAERMRVIGVTGTNGKTTVCSLLRQCLEEAAVPAGQIGTVGNYVRNQVLPTTLTTPQAVDLQRTLWQMAEAGTEVVAMEASSHGLDQHRVDGVTFDVGVFTNLSREHLDYHRSMEAYFSAKARLFEPGRARTGVMGVDDAWGRRLAHAATIPVLTVGHGDADVGIRKVEDHGLAGIGVELVGALGPVRLRSPLIGSFNASNVAMAYVVARHLGVDEESAAAGIARAGPAPGRVELVDAGQPFLVLVDYAHTPDALRAVLETARRLANPRTGRVSLVLGARGGRDRGKRPETGSVAVAGADLVVLTADNPGDEPVGSTIADLLAGIPAHRRDRVSVIPDRSEAIDQVVSRASPGDVVLVVGRGHETTYRIGAEVRTLDDRAAARQTALRWTADLCG